MKELSMPTSPHEPGHSLEELSLMITPSEVSGYAQSFEVFDKSQEDMLIEIERLFNAPHDSEQVTTVVVEAAKLVRSFLECVKQINSTTDENLDLRIESTLQLVKGEYDKRLQTYDSLLVPHEPPVNRIDIRDTIKELYLESGSYQEASNSLTIWFAQELKSDTENLFSYLSVTSQEHYDLGNLPGVRVILKLGHFAVDAVKTGIKLTEDVLAILNYYKQNPDSTTGKTP